MKKLNKSEIRTKHLNNLAKIIELNFNDTKVAFKDLKAIEMNGHKAAEDYCNGVLNSDQYDVIIEELRTKVNVLIPNKELVKNLHFNGDPRGHFLKINDDYIRNKKLVIETDWGGYGIICPEGI